MKQRFPWQVIIYLTRTYQSTVPSQLCLKNLIQQIFDLILLQLLDMEQQNRCQQQIKNQIQRKEEEFIKQAKDHERQFENIKQMIKSLQQKSSKCNKQYSQQIHLQEIIASTHKLLEFFRIYCIKFQEAILHINYHQQQLKEQWMLKINVLEGNAVKFINSSTFQTFFQIINYITIKASNQVQNQLYFKTIIQATKTIGILYWSLRPNTVKHILIFYFNFIKKINKNAEGNQKVQKQVKQFLYKMLEQILNHHYNLNEMESIKDINNKMKSQQKHEILIKRQNMFIQQIKQQQCNEQFEWLGYIFEQISFFSTSQRVFPHENSFLSEYLQLNGTSMKGCYKILHMLGNYIQNVIDERLTTHIVQGYECELVDVKEMYRKQNKKNTVIYRISAADLQYICTHVFKDAFQRYRAICRKYILRKIQIIGKKGQETIEKSKGNGLDSISQEEQQQFQRVSEVLLECCHILNCTLFIGGYNNKVQDIIIKDLLQSNKTFLMYLQLSFVIYRLAVSDKFKSSKVDMLVELHEVVKKRMFQMLEIQCVKTNQSYYLQEVNNQNHQISIEGMDLKKLISNGQMVSILRVLTNLVHINHRAQKPFEKQVKYLHIVMSLSHQSNSQVTMKEWAVMFLRNVTEWSEILREEIGKIQMEVKLTQY